MPDDVVVPPGPGTGTFAWDPGLDAPVVDLLKSKGMYDDPIKGANGLAKSYFELNRLQSGATDVVGVPGAEAKPEDWGKVFDKWRPKTPDDYNDVFKFPEGAPVSDGVVSFGKKLFHQLGVPKALVPAALAEWGKFAATTVAEAQTAQKMKNDDAVKAMRTKYGDAVFDSHVANGQNVLKTLKANGRISDETLNAVEGNIGTSALLEIMFAIGEGMKEGKVIGTGSGTPTPTDPGLMTPEQASTAMAALRKDEDFLKKYNDKNHPEHAVSVQRMLALTEASIRKAA